MPQDGTDGNIPKPCQELFHVLAHIEKVLKVQASESVFCGELHKSVVFDDIIILEMGSSRLLTPASLMMSA
jgi:hypothetical protein